LPEANFFRNSDGEGLGGERAFISGFAASVRASLAEGGRAIKVNDVIYNGRPAWQAVIPGPPTAWPTDSTEPSASPINVPPEAVVVVDRKTGLLVHVARWESGGARTVVEMSHLEIDAPLAADAFAPAMPAGTHVLETDDGMRFLSLDQARNFVGFTVPTPTQVPDGFRLGEVIVHHPPAGTGGDQLASPYWVDQEWRRGLDSFSVQALAVSGSQSENDAESAHALAGAPAPHSTKLHGGVFDGRTAFTALGPDPAYDTSQGLGPVLMAGGNGVRVTIGGDLTRQELLDVAASLKD
jgi:hypothetical protein